jgi:hypothetical protein
MRLRLFSIPAPAPATVLAVYPMGRWTAHLEQKADGRTQWICDCEKFRTSAMRNIPPWCQHVSLAAAQRSVERVTGERPPQRSASFTA